MQTYQAYQLSRLVPRRWINRFVIALVIVNCLFVPIVSRVLRKHRESRPITLLTVDVALDFILMVIVPLAVLVY